MYCEIGRNRSVLELDSTLSFHVFNRFYTWLVFPH